MGRWVVSIVIIGGILVGGGFLWIWNQKPTFAVHVVRSLTEDLAQQKQLFTDALPSDLQFAGDETWSLDLKGDELWVTAPSLKKNSGPLGAEDWERARVSVQRTFHDWFARKPGDPNRFPVVVKFRNETD
jgi:hypothetical protein